MAYYNRDRAMATPPYLLTAYGIAQRHGYSGTEEEWLASLVGAPGEAVDLRFDDDTKYIQYKHESDTEWTNLVSMEDLMTEDEAAVLAAMEEIKAAVETAVETAGGHSEDAEAWAVGKRGGTDVEETDETYHNNAKYYAGEAAGSATAAAASVTSAANQSHNASVFAANAASSASSAQNSASSASSSASSASGSALSAQNAATTAAESAVSAGESASSAAAALSDAESIMTRAQTAANSAFSDAERAHNWEQEAERQAALAAGAAQGAASEVSQALQQYADRAETAATTATEQAGAASDSATAAAQSAEAAAESARTLTIDTTLTQAGQAADAKKVGDEITDLKSAIDKIELTETGNDITLEIDSYLNGFSMLRQNLAYSAEPYTKANINITYRNLLADVKPANAINATFTTGSSQITVQAATNARVYSIPCLPNTDYEMGQGYQMGWSFGLGDEPARVGATVYNPISMSSRVYYTTNTGTHSYIYIQVTRKSIYADLGTYHAYLTRAMYPNSYVPYTPCVYNSLTLPNNYYGGYIDYLNGKVYSIYDANGDELTEPIVTDITPISNTITEIPVNIWGDGNITVGYLRDTKEYIDEIITPIHSDISDIENELQFDNVPTYNSNKLVNSGGIYTALSSKLNKPIADGTIGQILSNEGNGQTKWINNATPTQDQINSAVNAYLEDNPPIAIPDNSITKVKLAESLKLETIKEYVTPEMYNAVGDGITDDTTAVQDAINSGLPVKCYKTYLVTEIDVTNTDIEILGKIIGQVNVHNNVKIHGGTIEQNSTNPCVKFTSTLSGNQGYMNSYLYDCNLKPTANGIGIQLHADSNALFGVWISDIDITSCDKSIYIYNNRWLTKCGISNVYCHTPSYAIFVNNLQNTNTYCADITFTNVYAQHYQTKPVNFMHLESGNCLFTFRDSFCYDGIEDCHFYIPSSSDSTRLTIFGLKNSFDSTKFTNQNSLRCFYFTNNYVADSLYLKMSGSNVPPTDYYGGLYFENFSSAPALTGSRFAGIVSRGGSIAGGGEANKIFGLSFYDGRLSVLRSTDGTIANGKVFEVSTPYSGGVYTIATLPTGVSNGAKCWCSDIKMDVTYYSGTWYKPDGTAVS